jgi:prolyl-tRNA synthetase
MMKDLYSFHETQEDLDIFYQKVRDTYCHILESFNLSVVVVEAHSGSIGGSRSQEFMVLSETGEDDIVCCLNCRIGFNKEVGSQKNKCDICGQDLVPKKAIEVGHIFQLDTIYSEKMKAFFTDQKGAKKPIIMGCYGLGLPRILATIVEVHHDQNGIKWPEKASPFLCHLLSFRQEEASKKVYDLLQKNKINVLWDDRDLSAGEKMKDSDLIGIPYRLIISDKTKGRIEYKKRGDSEVKLLSPEEILELF